MTGKFSVNKDKATGESVVENIIDVDDEIIDVDDETIDVDVDEIIPAPTKKPETKSHTTPRGDLEDDELSQPFVDIHELFNIFNQKHFGGRITGTYVEYSSRMTLCAGTCTFKGPLGGCRIALSEPLLKFRPRSDLLSTLAHELIHAYLFVTEGVAVRDGVDGHGPKFLAHAQRINRAERGRLNITPYHIFTDEVDIYRVHHWTCNRCSMVIKRAMNRAPAPRDPFWPRHEKKCSGSFIKTKEPEKKKKVVKRAPKRRAVAVDLQKKSKVELPNGVMRTHRIDSMLAGGSSSRAKETVACPVCNVQIAKLQLNDHLDKCLSPGIFSQSPVEEVYIPDLDDDLDISRRSPSETGTKRRNGSEDMHSSALYSAVDSDGAPSQGHHAIGSSSKRPRTELNGLKRMIPDTEMLMSLSINPFSVNRKSLFQAFKIPTGDANREEHVESDDVSSILKPFLENESPYALQQKGREQLLRYVGRGTVVPEAVIHELAEQRGLDVGSLLGTLLSKAKRKKDGSYVVSGDILQQIRADSSGPSTAANARRADTIEVNEQLPRRAGHSTTQDFTSGASSRGSQAVKTVGRVSNGREGPTKGDATRVSQPQAKDRMEKCPVCDISVARSQLEAHVHRCLSDTDLGPFVLTGGDGSSACGNEEPSQHARPEERKASNGSGLDAQPRCPLCDLAMSREELQAHVQACMVSEGLEDVF